MRPRQWVQGTAPGDVRRVGACGLVAPPPALPLTTLHRHAAAAEPLAGKHAHHLGLAQGVSQGLCQECCKGRSTAVGLGPAAQEACSSSACFAGKATALGASTGEARARRCTAGFMLPGRADGWRLLHVGPRSHLAHGSREEEDGVPKVHRRRDEVPQHVLGHLLAGGAVHACRGSELWSFVEI